jgi:hypothetical protein
MIIAFIENSDRPHTKYMAEFFFWNRKRGTYKKEPILLIDFDSFSMTYT